MIPYANEPSIPTLQLAHASEAQTVIWKPQEGPQTALLQCPVFEVFYGGARGGGKTESSIGDWLQHSAQYGEDAIGIFFRRKLVQLAEVIARTKILFKKLGAKYNEQKKEWVMANGARLKFAYLEKDVDAEEYQGHSYTRVYVEEVTNFPSPSPINKLRATLRSGAGVPCGMRLTGNPGGPGHQWVKKRYIDPNPQGYEVFYDEELVELPDGTSRMVRLGRVFIPSKLRDNALLLQNDPTYIIRLRQSGSEALVRAWLEGDWNIVDGAYFDCFDPSRHILPYSLLTRIPPGTQRFRAFDWGSAKPFSVGWYALSDGTWGLPKGALLKYREWYGSDGTPNKGLKMTADLVARGIVEREKGEVIKYGSADPSIFIRDGGPSIAETMNINKCQWRRADNKRKAGWEQLRMRLVGDTFPDFAASLGLPVDTMFPMLYFLETCDDTLRTLPTLQHDDTDTEDLDTDAEDHSADETRYAVMSRPWLPRAKTADPGLSLLRSPGQYTINEIMKMQKRKSSNNTNIEVS